MSATTLLAFDFDGTLAPICDDPAAVQMNRGAAALLHEAATVRGIAVGIVSGRDMADLESRTQLAGAYLVGSHGLEIRAPGGVLIRDQPPLPVDIPSPLREEIAGSGMRIERKKHAIALHWRGIDYDRVMETVRQFRRWAVLVELDVIDGRCVIEARCRGGGKEEAVRWLASALGASRVLYAGDDLTDFAALRFAAEHGRGFFIANSERTPPPNVTVVDSFRELFRLVREEVLM